MAKQTNQATKPDKKSKVVDKTFTIAELSKQHGRNPKAVRAKLRKMDKNDDSKLPQTVKGGQGRWTFAVKDLEAMTTIVLSLPEQSAD